MFLKSIIKFLIISNLLYTFIKARNCFYSKNHLNLKFSIWRFSQRSLAERLFVDNVNSLEACEELAIKYKGLAFNYSPKEKFERYYEDRQELRDYFWNQPHLYFNCHILQCPENKTFKTLVNDTSFDYFSLYEKPIDTTDYICLPEVGLFVLQTLPQTYENASITCRHIQTNCGILAHIASQKRTEGLAHLIQNYNEQQSLQLKSKVFLAFVGLQYNASWSHDVNFFNSERENLKCFPYRAWEAGNPKTSLEFMNASCVALTVNRTWRSVKCDRKLPFICEILTACGRGTGIY